jgi:hypothetical protein
VDGPTSSTGNQYCMPAMVQPIPMATAPRNANVNGFAVVLKSARSKKSQHKGASSKQNKSQRKPRRYAIASIRISPSQTPDGPDDNENVSSDYHKFATHFAGVER